MIGPNGSGKSSVFDALNCYTYILRNSAYPSDDIVIDPLKLSHMIDYYLKNDNPIPFFPVAVEDIVSMCTTSYSRAFLKGVTSRATKVSKAVLVLCQSLIEGYSFLSLIRASSVVNRQWTVEPC